MKKFRFTRPGVLTCLGMSLFLWACGARVAPAASVEFVDASGEKIVIHETSPRAVSLVPGITEILCRIGAGDALRGITYHSTYPPETAGKDIVGGFFSPSLEAIDALAPDVIFISSIHSGLKERLRAQGCVPVHLQAETVDEIYRNISLLGRVFQREERAADLIDRMKRRLGVIREKVARIPSANRMRVMRLMGRDRVMTPGDDSFQNAYIRLAGGIPPKLGKKGHVVPVTKEEWMAFNPQVVYGCGGDRVTAERLLTRPGWRDVEAVREGRILYFPCDMTCRASTRAADFVSWLSARIYRDAFKRRDGLVHEDQILGERKLVLDLDYVEDSRVVLSSMDDFPNKTLVIDFKRPLKVVSTLEGEKEGVTCVGNHSSPPPCWSLNHDLGLGELKKRVCGVMGREVTKTAMLFTGADMDNLSVKATTYRDMTVRALVTAGVASNAVRMSADTGRFYEPGTINILLLSNRKLSPRAMTRALISATEAKTAALADMDVRSSDTPLENQATGTGTDNIVVVEGAGPLVDNTGGHTKMGELIASAVYEAVKEAVFRQNGLIPGRSVFQRLKERGISIHGLAEVRDCECSGDGNEIVRVLEEILLRPEYGAFVHAAFSVSDDYERGLISDLSGYEAMCRKTAARICGNEVVAPVSLDGMEGVPVVLKMALEYLRAAASCRVASPKDNY